MHAGVPSLAAVLPLKVTGAHYGQNLARLDLLLSSLLSFGEPGLLDDFVIVAPSEEVPLARAYAANWPELPLRVLDEETHFPAFARYQRPWQRRPWQRQQVIKLNSPALTDADYVLTLDPDVLAVRPLTRAALFPDGRALLEYEARSIHPQWWRDSADLLDLSADLAAPGMGVTPALLSREVLLAVHDRLTACGRRPWMDVLLTSYCNWTEYTLYLLSASHAGLLSGHHRWCGEDPSVPHLQVPSDVSIWERRAATVENIDRLLSGEQPGMFAVAQSNTGVDPDTIARHVERRIPVRHTHPISSATTPGPTSRLGERSRTAARLAATTLYRGRRRLRSKRSNHS